ncbi:MAG: thiamine ABC transporter substrate-binding protein [Acidimicrobiia bacterium]
MRKIAVLVIAGAIALAACGGTGAQRPTTLKLLAHDSFASGVTDETFAAFTDETGIEVEVISGGDAGAMVNQAALTAGNPIADVMFGVDDTFLSRAIDAGVFTSHRSTRIDEVESSLVPTSELITPIDFGDVCLNYDKQWFTDNAMTVPSTLDDLRTAQYASLTTVESPATSSPGLAFLLATIDFYGEDGWQEFWRDMKAGGVATVPDWDTAYYANFTPYGGSTPIVVSYASSPPAEVIYATEPLTEAPTGVIEAGCYRQVEYAGVLAGSDYPESAGELIDYMLSVDFQETIPLTWFVFPANAKADLPEEFTRYTTLPQSPARLDAQTIADNRDRWIADWSTIMEG